MTKSLTLDANERKQPPDRVRCLRFRPGVRCKEESHEETAHRDDRTTPNPERHHQDWCADGREAVQPTPHFRSCNPGASLTSKGELSLDLFRPGSAKRWSRDSRRSHP